MGCGCGNKAREVRNAQRYNFVSADGKTQKVVRSETEAKVLKARLGGTYSEVAAR